MVSLYADPLTVRGSTINSIKEDCHYSDWSSCSYYCEEQKVETRYKTLVEAIPKESRAMCPLRQEAECGTIACTGNNEQASTT